MATITKTIQTALLTPQTVSSNTVVTSSVLDVSTKFACFIGIHFGRQATTALTTGVTIRIEGSTKSSGDGLCFVLAQWLTDITAAESEAVNGTVNAGTKVVTVASTTNLVAGDLIAIINGTIGNSEFARIKSISANTSVTIEDDLQNAQTGATIYDQAQFFSAQIDLTSVTRLRAVVDASGSGQNTIIEIEIITADSIA